MATVITSVPRSEKKFPATKGGLKRFRVDGVVYAKSATQAKEYVAKGVLDAAAVTK